MLAVAIVLLGALVLLPGIGRPGLWEPQEMAVADEAAARADGTFRPPAAVSACSTEPDPSGPRTLTPRAAAWGLRHVSSSDAGLRIPMVLIGLLGALGVFGLGLRLGSTRAGLVSAIVFMSFPLWSLQARMLTGELAGPVGATLVAYGLCVIAAPRRDAPVWLAVDLLVAALAILLGARLAYQGSGALVGLLPPLVAVAIAGGFAAPALGRWLAAAWAAIDRKRERAPAGGEPLDGWRTGAVILATVATAAVAVWIAHQVFTLAPRTPGTREVADHSILTSDCWSSAVGGLWRKDDNLGSTYDSLFEQAGFGMFPWSVLAVIALGTLASGLGGPRRRFAGAMLFAWAAAGWVCAAVFQRKIGTVVFPGFPACAIGIGLFVDEMYDRRASALTDPAPYRDAAWTLCGLAVLASVIVLAKDLQAFPERMTSFLIGTDQIKYPAQARLLGVHTRTWILVLGVLAALPFALDLLMWRPPRKPGEPATFFESTGLPRIAHHGATAALVATIFLSLFWTHGWHRSLSRNLSSKHIFSVYRDLRKPGDTLGIMGSMGNSPRYYAAGKWDTLDSREALIAYLKRPTRVFAMAPAGELCAIHKSKADGLNYFVIDDSNTQTLLLSNQLGDQKDRNPIATSILRERPKDVGTPISGVVYDDAIEIIGVKLPATVGRGDKFEVTMTYHVLKPVGGAWRVFAHFDGSQRFNGDHDPIRGRCATNYWQPGDYIVDRFTASAGDVSFAKGSYDMWVGFFTGSNPNWRNMPVSAGAKDNNNRVKVGSIRLR